MPNKRGKMTPQERVFVEQYARTSDGVYAATKAGYGSPDKRASQTLAKPAIVDAIKQRQQERLNTQGAEIGINTLFEVAQDLKAPSGARVKAATEILDRCGFAKQQDDTAVKEPFEMTPDEAGQYLRVAQARLLELAENAQLVPNVLD
jgi:phage terminase small subunit